jgi:hypothetical protein
MWSETAEDMLTAMKTYHKIIRKHTREADLKSHVDHPPIPNLQVTLTMIMLRDLIQIGLPQIQDLDLPDPGLDLEHILHLILLILVQSQLSMKDQDQISTILFHFHYLLHHSMSHHLM